MIKKVIISLSMLRERWVTVGHALKITNFWVTVGHVGQTVFSRAPIINKNKCLKISYLICDGSSRERGTEKWQKKGQNKKKYFFYPKNTKNSEIMKQTSIKI